MSNSASSEAAKAVVRRNTEEVSDGTEVTIVCTNLPAGLRAEDNEAGSRLSLEQLARRFE